MKAPGETKIKGGEKVEDKEIKKERDYAIAVFYDDDLNIYVQERGGYTKMGEQYTFWGGMIEDGETPKDAIFRELEEELGLEPKNLEYWGDYSFVIQEEGKYKGYKLNVSVFITQVDSNFDKTEVKEGTSVVVFPIQKVINGEGFLKGMASFMPELQGHLRSDLGKK